VVATNHLHQRWWVWILGLGALLALCAGCASANNSGSSLANIPQSTPSQPARTYGPSAQQLASEFVSDIQHQRYQAAYQLCGPLYTSKVTAAQFAALWRQRDATAGPIVSYTVGRSLEDQLTATVVVFVQRARMPSPPPTSMIFMAEGPTTWQIIKFNGM